MNSDRKAAAIPWRMYLLVAIVGIIVASLAAYSWNTGFRIHTEYVPQQQAARQIKLEATTLHLWFEEIISGDRDVDMDLIWAHLRRADWYAQALLNGGTDTEQRYAPVTGDQLRRRVETIRRLLAEYDEVIRQRVEQSDRFTPGSALDQRSDSLYAALLEESDRLDTELQRVLARDLSRSRVAQIILLVILVLSAGLVIVILHRDRRRWGQDLRAAAQARDALRESEQKYRNLVELSPDAAVILQDNEFKYISPAFTAIFGYDQQDINRGLLYPELAQEWDREAIRQRYEDRLAGKDVPRTYHVDLVSKDGRIVPCETSATRIDYEGRPAVLVIFRDISERKKVQRALQREQERAQEYLDIAGAILMVLDVNGNISLINQKGCEVLEAGKEELIGKNWFDNFLPDEIRKDVRQVFAALMAAESAGIEYFENPLVTTSGKKKIISWHNRILTDAAGKRSGTLSSGEDITERKRAENALRESEEKYRGVVETMNDGLIIHNENMTISYVNGRMCEIWGYTAEELVGRSATEVVGDEDRKIMEDQIRRRRRGEAEPYEINIRHKDDRLVSVLVSPQAMLSPDGTFQGSFSVVTDITELKRAEELIRVQRDLGVSLSVARGLEEGLHRCLEAAFQVSGMDCGGIYFLDRDSRTLDMAYHHGLPPAFIDAVTHYEADSENVRLVLAGKPVYARHEELGLPLGEFVRHEGLKALTVIPVRDEEGVIGCLNLASHQLDDVPHFARSALEAIAAQFGSAAARLRAQEALREREESYRTLSTNLPGIVYRVLIRENNRMVFFNDMGEQITGYRSDELAVGEICSIDPLILDEDHQRVVSIVKQAINEDSPFEIEYRIRHKNGTTRYLIERGRPIRGLDGKPLWIDGVILDVTERRRAEEELLKARDELEARVRERTTELSRANKDLINEIRVREHVEKKLREHQNELQTLASELSLAEERERRRFAANLHDTISQNLVMAHMKLESLIAETLPGDVAASIQQANRMVGEALESTQTLTFELSPPVLHRLGLGPAIESLGDRMRQLHGLKVELVDRGPAARLTEELSAFLFRATRELLINVVKHARTRNAKVSISRTRSQIKVEVEDRGIGFDPVDQKAGHRRGEGFGLFSIQERLTHLGGSLTIWSKPGRGTRISMSAPLKTAGKTAEEIRA